MFDLRYDLEEKNIFLQLKEVETMIWLKRFNEADKIINKVYEIYTIHPKYFTEMDRWTLFILLDKISIELYK